MSVSSLASITLPSFVTCLGTFDFSELYRVVGIVTYNLNCILDIDQKPAYAGRRPISIGFHGLAETFVALGLPFESTQARDLNIKIAQTMYHAAMQASCEFIERFGVYDGFHGSPASKGILQYNMWGVEPVGGEYDWDALKHRIQLCGLSNSVSIALTSTLTTTLSADFTDSFQPRPRWGCITRCSFTVPLLTIYIFSNLQLRQTGSEKYQVISHWLVYDLVKLDLWNEDICLRILAANGQPHFNLLFSC